MSNFIKLSTQIINKSNIIRVVNGQSGYIKPVKKYTLYLNNGDTIVFNKDNYDYTIIDNWVKNMHIHWDIN
jgi:hypothetical protein